MYVPDCTYVQDDLPPPPFPFSDKPEKRALRILLEAYDTTKAFGSSTALVASMDHSGSALGVANLGDSTLVVLRRNRDCHMTTVLRTREQQHTFNCPFQLSRLPQPEHYDKVGEKRGGRG